jgi:hypothetical protein
LTSLNKAAAAALSLSGGAGAPTPTDMPGITGLTAGGAEGGVGAGCANAVASNAAQETIAKLQTRFTCFHRCS